MAIDLEKAQETLRNKMAEYFGDKVVSIEIVAGQLVLIVDREVIVAVCEKLRDDPDFQYNALSYLTAIDRSALKQEPRYEVVYELLSHRNASRLRVKAGVPDEDPTIDSMVDVWGSAEWMEREAFDMFGILFKNHPDLRRILMPEDWEGHPLRKDFPLGGVKSFYFKRATQPRAGEPQNLVPRIREQTSDI